MGYEGRYEVSNLGRVKALHYMNCNDKVAIMKDEQNQDHYKRIELRYEGRRAKYMVHRLVAEAFIPNPENKRYVDHINGDRHDDRAVLSPSPALLARSVDRCQGVGGHARAEGAEQLDDVCIPQKEMNDNDWIEKGYGKETGTL